MKNLPNQEFIKKTFDYDTDKGRLRWKIDASTRVKKGDLAGYVDYHGYRIINMKNNPISEHQLIWLWNYGYLPENDIDHINRIKDDNRIENLREVSRSCNMRNCGNFKHNNSGVKGVRFDNERSKWASQIQVNNSHKALGRYRDFDEAVLARLAAEQCLNWSGCDRSSPAYCYAKRKNLIK